MAFEHADRSGWAPRRPALHPVGGGSSALDLDLPSWMDLALCAQVDQEIFFPEKGGSTKQAKLICQACPVLAQCLKYAMDNDERFGIWGGTSERERRAMKKAEQAQVAAS